MTKYRITHEEWKIDGIGKNYEPTREEFFEYATDNPNGADFDEEVGLYDTKEEALAELEKYRCTYDIWENYHEARYDLYAVEELVYDEDGDIEEYRLIRYADVDI